MSTALAEFTSSNRGILSKIAREIGVQRAAVCKWQTRGIPAERVLDVERLTGLSRSLLRPDLYPSDGGPRAVPEPLVISSSSGLVAEPENTTNESTNVAHLCTETVHGRR